MFSGTNSRRFPTACTVIIRAVGVVVDAGTVLRVHRVAAFCALQQAAKDVFILNAYKAADGSQPVSVFGKHFVTPAPGLFRYNGFMLAGNNYPVIFGAVKIFTPAGIGVLTVIDIFTLVEVVLQDASYRCIAP